MYQLLLSLQLLITVSADTTQYPFPYSIKRVTKSFDWKNYELKLSQRFKDSVLLTLMEEYPFYIGNPDADPEYYIRSFHFVNLNGDSCPDLVYEGWTGSEGNMVQFYLNRQYSMEKVYKDFMNIIDWKFDNNRLSSVVIFNPGCCAETVQFERHIRFDGAFKPEVTLQRAILIGMDVFEKDFPTPEGYFPQPVPFKTLNEEYSLRYSPVITDSVPLTWGDDEKKGNIIALYPKGSRGIAWAYKKDDIGREWWLVEMQPQVFLSFSRYWDYDDQLTHYYGWMSSRFLEKLVY